MINFKKIASFATTAIMLGSTAALAAASTYPAPFLDSGAVNGVIVLGSHTAAITDNAAAIGIQNSFGLTITGGGGVQACDDDSIGVNCVKVAKPSTKFQLGRGVLDVISGTLTDSDLSDLLADGEYLDDENAEKSYTQKILLGNLSLVLFEDSAYKEDVPTLGFNVQSSTFVLNYTLDFSDRPDWADMPNTDINIMGKNYFISSVTTNTTLNLLDSASTVIIKGGETKTVDVDGAPYDISINVMDANGVIFDVNGVSTNKINTGQTFKLGGNTYIGLKEFINPSRESDVQYAEVSIGTGKIELKAGNDVKINEKTITDLTVYMTNAGNEQLDKITIQWKAEDDMFITEDSTIAMPGFDNIKLSFAGMTYPSMEEFSVKHGSSTYMQLKSFPIKSGTTDINLVYGNGTDFIATGKESGNALLTSITSEIIFDDDLHDYFVATYDDGTNAESYLMRATSFSADDGVNRTNIQYKKDGSFVNREENAEPTDTINLGSVSLTINDIDRSDKTVNITGGTSVSFHTLFSEEGMKVFLPYDLSAVNYTATPGQTGAVHTNITGIGATTTTFDLRMSEEDKNGNKGAGKNITYTLGWTSSKTTVSTIAGELPDGGKEIGDSDDFRSFVYGPLATEMLYKIGGDQDYVDVTYHGDESYGNVFVAAAEAVSTSGSLKFPIVKDTEASSITGQNLVIVGGSCVNSLAAEVLSVAYPTCGSDWTSTTTVGSGSFLIETYGRDEGKVATLIAGYEGSDTKNAATYFTTQGVDTSIGMKYVGTTGTEATLVV